MSVPDGNVNIRTYQPSDDSRIVEITKAAWTEVTMCKMLEDKFGVRGGKPWWHYKSEPILLFAREHPEQFIVAEDDGVVCGYATYMLDHESKVGTVANNAVDPVFGRKGIGSAMHRGVLNAMKMAGMEVAYLMTFEHDTAARKMYEKHGFTEIARHVNYVRSLKDL